jgi:hypothetical protein
MCSIRKWANEAAAQLKDWFASRLEYVPGLI